ncbi:uncharacterized protein LOC103949104 isoform X3 [Pyrus x bretschneideri]|uniref:uncharacterized protein LOC103949104 isoform X3 n=1 Tax=Pyrus x bretschneideri TaxID=225117 RepID=UPI00202FA68F|nr:uncharacterized protein LOC103949104 isoform X3 [Pyrus x bretschneideri]
MESKNLRLSVEMCCRMEKVAKKYKAEFVVDISNLGEDDPLMQNGTRHFSSLKVPWYTTRVSEGKGRGYFQKMIKLPCEKTLDVIVVDTGLLLVCSNLFFGLIYPIMFHFSFQCVCLSNNSLHPLILNFFNVKNLTVGSLNEVGNTQLHWLRRTLETTGSNWRIVVGFHPLATCEDVEERMEAKQVFDSLRSTLQNLK